MLLLVSYAILMKDYEGKHLCLEDCALINNSQLDHKEIVLTKIQMLSSFAHHVVSNP